MELGTYRRSGIALTAMPPATMLTVADPLPSADDDEVAAEVQA